MSSDLPDLGRPTECVQVRAPSAEDPLLIPSFPDPCLSTANARTRSFAEPFVTDTRQRLFKSEGIVIIVVILDHVVGQNSRIRCFLSVAGSASDQRRVKLDRKAAPYRHQAVQEVCLQPDFELYFGCCSCSLGENVGRKLLKPLHRDRGTFGTLPKRSSSRLTSSS
ncbi:hypothetical protein KC341_g93 [Hortaea werneckii]|nr:hypothetical protein KC341_g93 [Hortaea werneckii]